MAIVTLINDWRQDALYLSQINGALVSVNTDLRIIDMTPKLGSFDELTAAFILKNTFFQFPKGTIHLNFVSHYKKNASDFLIAEYQNHFFVSRNNGFLSNVFDEKPEKLYRLELLNASFVELELYPIIVKAILRNSLSKIAEEYTSQTRSAIFQPVINENNIIIHIVYIDVYGNLITNLKKKLFEEKVGEKNFKIFFSGKKNYVEKLYESYEDIDQGNLFAMFNSIGLLEIGMKSANMAELFSIQKSDEISVEIIKKAEPEPGKIF